MGLPFNTFSAICCLLIWRFHNVAGVANFEKLTRHNIEPGGITISGISGGGSFAGMFSVIYSSFVKGVGLFAGAPYGTALIGIESLVNLWNFTRYRVLVDYMDSRGFIDSTDNIRNMRAWIFQGSADQIVPFFLSRFALGLYRYYGATTKDMIGRVPTGHCIPTQHKNDQRLSTILIYNAICGTGYSGVNDMLSFFYPESWVDPNREPGSGHRGRLFKFDQDEFFKFGNATYWGFKNHGWAYIPWRCDPKRGNPCKVHFYFHGCTQSIFPALLSKIPEYVTDAGFLEAADANDIITIFPQIELDITAGTTNLVGCFDLYSYTSWLRITFATKWGAQPLAIKKMYERLLVGYVE